MLPYTYHRPRPVPIFVVTVTTPAGHRRDLFVPADTAAQAITRSLPRHDERVIQVRPSKPDVHHA